MKTKTKKKMQSNQWKSWGFLKLLTPEEVITWLEGHRQWMFEIWKNDPKLRKKWEKINL